MIRELKNDLSYLNSIKRAIEKIPLAYLLEEVPFFNAKII